MPEPNDFALSEELRTRETLRGAMLNLLPYIL